MKAIKMRIQKFSRPGVILMATVVTIITSMVVANATQTITTPNAAFISYSLAVGTNSAAITPASNRSVLVMGCCTTLGDQGAGHASLLHLPSPNGFVWVGLDSPNNPAIVGTVSNNPGTRIAFISLNHDVAIRVASADTIVIENNVASGGTRAGNVTLVW